MQEFVDGLTGRLAATFDPAHAGEALAAFLIGAVVAMLVLVAYWVAWRGVRTVLRALLRRTKVDRTSTAFTETLLLYALMGIATVHALDAAGVNTASILASLGVVGLTVGFAARDALSNVVSGLLIFWDRPFVLGDLVEIGDSYGRVDRITLRSTRVVTPDGRMLAVPNTTVIGQTVASYTNFPHLRLDLRFTVGLHEEIGRVRSILLAVVAADPEFMDDPKPSVSLVACGDYNIELEVRAWIRDEREHTRIRPALRERCYQALLDAGVDMPFETIQLQPLEVVQRTA